MSWVKERSPRSENIWLDLIYHNPLETTLAVGFIFWLLYLVAPWNPWDSSTVSAEAMDRTGVQRSIWVSYVILTTSLKVFGVFSGAYTPRILGAVLGFSFWVFISVVIVRYSPTSILIPGFVSLACGSALVFMNLNRERARARNSSLS